MTYFKDTLVMFMGGIMVALAVEYSGLHKRLALRVIQMVGTSPRRCVDKENMNMLKGISNIIHLTVDCTSALLW